MNILLDPYILAVPEQDEQVQAYIENLYTWTTAITKKEHHFWISQSMLDALWDANRYPLWSVLQQFEQRLEQCLPQDRIYNINTLMRACEPQLMTPPLLDDLFSNSILYYDDEEVVVIPYEIEARLPKEVSYALRKTLVLSAIGRQLEVNEVFENLLFGTASNGFRNKQLNVNFRTQHIETEEGQEIAYALDMLFTPDEVSEVEDLVSFWQNTSHAIEYVHKKLFATDSTPPVCPTVFSHPLFNRQVANYNIDRRSVLLFKLFRVIVLGLTGDIPRKQKTHHVLHNNEKPVKRGDITAWRLWIEYGAPGWRVHYWLYPDGSVELANFVKHDNFTIPEPSRKS